MHGSLATRLRVLRAERGLTVRQVAELSGVAKETISQIERGERHPYDRTLAKLARAYEVPVEELLSAEAEKQEQLAAAGKAEAPREAGRRTEAEEESRSYDVPEFLVPDFGAAREGLERYCDDWERRLAEDTLDLESIEGFFAVLDQWDWVLDAAIYAEFSELIRAGRFRLDPETLDGLDELYAESQLGLVGLRYGELSDKLLEAAKALKLDENDAKRLRRIEKEAEERRRRFAVLHGELSA
jgi:transcriptional regulator with XRE-family HTH domain